MRREQLVELANQFGRLGHEDAHLVLVWLVGGHGVLRLQPPIMNPMGRCVPCRQQLLPGSQETLYLSMVA